MIQRDLDEAILTLAEDELTGMLETRQTLDVGSKEYTLLTNAVDKSEQKLNETYKTIYDHQAKIKDIEETAKFRQAELEQKAKQHEAELRLKEQELDQKEKQFRDELEQKERQHQIEMEQKEKENKSRCIWTFVGVGVTAAVSLTTAIVCKKMDFANYAKWMPELMNFEKEDSFTYAASKAMERSILKQ